MLNPIIIIQNIQILIQGHIFKNKKKRKYISAMGNANNFNQI